MRVSRIGVAAIAGALMMALLPALAHADWSRPRPLDERGWWTVDPDIAVDRHGRALIAWAGEPESGTAFRLRFRRLDAAGRFSRVRTVPGDAAVEPAHISVAVDHDGDALLAWSSFEAPDSHWQVWARRLSRRGVLGPLLRLSVPGRDSWTPQVALTPKGRGAVVFQEFVGDPQQGRLVLRRISPRSDPGNRMLLPPQARSDARLVATRGGAFVAAGITGAGEVQAARLLPDNRVRSRVISRNTRRSDLLIHLGVDRVGNAYLAYRTPGDMPVLWARKWGRKGALAPTHRISPRGQPAVAASAATDLDGDTILGWSHGPNSANYTASLRILRRNGSRGPVHLLGPINGEPLLSRVPDRPPLPAVDDDGNGVVVWESQPDPESGPLITWARRVRPDGSVGNKVRLGDRSSSEAVAVTPTGRARVIYYGRDNDRLLVISGP